MISHLHGMLTITDIAFASSAIITRDVAGAAFQYAKIQTLPFFGSGIVELPPEGFKRTKNSRKMHMAFFVHEGKVLVTVGPPATDSDKQQPETNEFAISKGGVWIVPRGMFFVFPSLPSNSHIPALLPKSTQMAISPCKRPRRAVNRPPPAHRRVLRDIDRLSHSHRKRCVCNQPSE